jgi:hypothetical protein
MPRYTVLLVTKGDATDDVPGFRRADLSGCLDIGISLEQIFLEDTPKVHWRRDDIQDLHRARELAENAVRVCGIKLRPSAQVIEVTRGKPARIKADISLDTSGRVRTTLLG